MDAELIVWMVFIVIWLISSVLKQVRRFGANRPGQDPTDPRPDVDTTSVPWESEPAPEPMHQRSETRPAQPSRTPSRRPSQTPSQRPSQRPQSQPPPPPVPPLLGELMKQLGVEVVQPERPREGHIADERTASEHEHTPGWHERTASEHEHTPGWHERTASEHRMTASEQRRTQSEHRGTRSEHVLTRGEHSLGEARRRAEAAPAVVPWGARRAVRRHPVVRDLHGRDSLVRAFLAQEILGPPKALQTSTDEGR